MLTRGPRTRLIAAVAPLVIAVLALGATGATGLVPAQPTALPDSAFRPVEVSAPASAGESAEDLSPAWTPGLEPILDSPFALATEPPERPQPDVPESEPIVVVRPTPTPKPEPKPEPKPASGGTLSGTATSGNKISGLASWYCRAGYSICTSGYPDTTGFDAYAAAGPRLRAAIGSGWRGMVVTVDGIRVKLIDWCQCYRSEPHEKLLDLYYDVFARTGTNVTVRW